MFVVELAGVQAVVELSEEFVEQVSLGLVVPISGGAAGAEVAAGSWGRAQRCQRPYRADGVEAAVFDMAVQDNGFLATGAGDGRRSGECFESAGISKTGAVIADLSEHPGTGKHSQAREAGDDRRHPDSRTHPKQSRSFRPETAPTNDWENKMISHKRGRLGEDVHMSVAAVPDSAR